MSLGLWQLLPGPRLGKHRWTQCPGFTGLAELRWRGLFKVTQYSGGWGRLLASTFFLLSSWPLHGVGGCYKSEWNEVQ